MSQRLYYDDAYTTEFTASVVRRLSYHGLPALILDQTYFYPESGGQPADRGTLNGVLVVDVQIHPDDGAVIHVLDASVDADEVIGRIEWSRRFDHMQQHTGQHILSQAFIRIAGANTVGFHLSNDYCTIDLDLDEMAETTVTAAEKMVNEIIWQNEPISVSYIDPDSTEAESLRKIPDVDEDTLRVISIGSFDRTACGGTHVTRTGEIGMIKVVKTERQRRQRRITFLCGRRALQDYSAKNEIARHLAARLTVGHWEVEEAVARLQDEYRGLRRQLRQEQRALLEMKADRLLAERRALGQWRIVRAVVDGTDPDGLRQLAGMLTRESATVALLATVVDGRAHLVLARAEDSPGSMRELIKPALATLDSTSGGGSPAIAQGTAPTADRDRLAQALKTAEALLAQQLT